MVACVVQGAGGLNAFYRVGTYQGTVADAGKAVSAALASGEVPFQILGSYNPGKDPKLMVIAFTRPDLQEICLKVDQGILASVMRIGLRETAVGQVEISLINPDFLFYAYLREAYEEYQIDLSPISMDIRMALIEMGQQFMPFGGSATEMELQRFRFTPSAPGFNEPVEIHTFASFEQAVATIEGNLRQRKGGAVQVFKQVHSQQQVAIYGIGLGDERTGDNFILSKLGNENVAALPYELVVMGKRAFILHAKYRLPLFWLDVSVRGHQQLYRTPRDIEELMKQLSN